VNGRNAKVVLLGREIIKVGATSRRVTQAPFTYIIPVGGGGRFGSGKLVEGGGKRRKICDEMGFQKDYQEARGKVSRAEVV